MKTERKAQIKFTNGNVVNCISIHRLERERCRDAMKSNTGR